MADIDRSGFAADVAAVLKARGWSYGAACAACPGLDKAMLSRAVNGAVLSAANHLALCAALGLDPLARLVARPSPAAAARMRADNAALGRRLKSLKEVLEQAVTRDVPRETGPDGGEARP